MRGRPCAGLSGQPLLEGQAEGSGCAFLSLARSPDGGQATAQQRSDNRSQTAPVPEAFTSDKVAAILRRGRPGRESPLDVGHEALHPLL